MCYGDLEEEGFLCDLEVEFWGLSRISEINDCGKRIFMVEVIEWVKEGRREIK